MAKFKTNYDRPKVTGEKIPRKSKTETAGYIPPKKQIESMMLAGIRLDIARKEMFDIPAGSTNASEPSVDPTRKPGEYDLADYTRDKFLLEQKWRDSHPPKSAPTTPPAEGGGTPTPSLAVPAPAGH